MAPKPASRNWNDVQTAIATVAIVTTLGMWNLFATPSKTKVTQPSEPTVPPTDPPTEPPMELAPASIPVPTTMPQVKIMFNGATPQASFQPAPIVQQAQAPKKKKNRNSSSSSGGGGTVTQTRTS
jgi:hypothetical protein